MSIQQNGFYLSGETLGEIGPELVGLGVLEDFGLILIEACVDDLGGGC